MRIVVRILMFLACLLYGAMPAQSAFSISMPDMQTSMMDIHDGHATLVDETKADSKDPCPHSDTMTHAAFCAACLLLIPELQFTEKGENLHGSPAPDLTPTIPDSIPAPLLPPPRHL